MSQKNNGKITLIIGPMFCGKTTEGLRLVDRERISDKSCLILKYAKDIRYDDVFITTHSEQRYNKADILHINSLSSKFINDIIQQNKYQVIFIDEGQFFKNIHIFANELANNNIYVIISALDGDFKQKIFGDIDKLIPLAEDVKKLQSICMICKENSGSYTVRTIESEKLELIGGTEIYKAMCRTCMNSYYKSKNN